MPSDGKGVHKTYITKYIYVCAHVCVDICYIRNLKSSWCSIFWDITPVAGFYQRKFKPKSASTILQALSCRFFVGWNWVIQVNPWFPKNWNQGSLYLYTMPGGFFEMVCSVKSPRAWRCRKRARPCLKNPRAGFWTKRNATNPWKLGSLKQVNCNRKIGRIELAESSLQIWA